MKRDKQQACLLERKRIKRNNEAFEQLKYVLHLDINKQISKREILAAAAHRITELTAIVHCDVIKGKCAVSVQLTV